MTAAQTVDFDFDDEPEEAGLPPLCTFRLGGKVWRVKNENYITLDVLNGAVSDDGMQVVDFFRGVIVDEEWQAFQDLLVNPPANVTIGKIRVAMQKVAGRVLGFPTTVDSGSSSTSAAKAHKRKSSAARSSSPATRRRASGE